MFNFDDRYIVLVILLPGIFLLGNLYWIFSLYPEVLPFALADDFNFSASVYGLVLSLILGGLCWFIQHKKWVIDAFDTTHLLNKLENKDIYNFDAVMQRYQADFKIPLLVDDEDIEKQKGYLKGSVDNIFFTMDRAFGLEKPSAYRLLIDMFSALVIAILLSLLFVIVITAYFVLSHYSEPLVWNTSVIVFSLFLCSLFWVLKLKIIPTMRTYYHTILFAVYVDNQYRNKIETFINGKTEDN